MTVGRWFGYSRYSTDQQNDKSNVDQQREHRAFLAQFAPGCAGRARPR
jgi:hypothetical protein